MAISTEILRRIIREGQEYLREVELYDRSFEFEQNGKYVLVGVRQAGKSYMLYKRARQLLKEGHVPEEFLYVDFDDERLMEMTASDLDSLLQTYMSVYQHNPIFFLDEIQNIDGWEHFARRLANRKYQVFITGSNAKMLSRDIHTTLGGRYLSETVFPYSFAEYIDVQGIVLEKEWMFGQTVPKVRQLFDVYLKWGGFPESLLFKNKRRWLNELYEKILLNDIILRNSVKNETALRMTLKRLAENMTKPVSYNRLTNLIKSTGTSTSVSSVSQYINYACDAFVIFPLENHASKFVEKETVKKHYFIDNGLLSIFLTENLSPLLENLCAVHLHKKYGDKLYFYNRGFEVDFYVPDEGLAIQACLSTAEEDTKKREIDALVKLSKVTDVKKMIIVTLDEESKISLSSNQEIEVIPAWKWLLQD